MMEWYTYSFECRGQRFLSHLCCFIFLRLRKALLHWGRLHLALRVLYLKIPLYTCWWLCCFHRWSILWPLCFDRSYTFSILHHHTTIATLGIWITFHDILRVLLARVTLIQIISIHHIRFTLRRRITTVVALLAQDKFGLARVGLRGPTYGTSMRCLLVHLHHFIKHFPELGQTGSLLFTQGCPWTYNMLSLLLCKLEFEFVTDAADDCFLGERW